MGNVWDSIGYLAVGLIFIRHPDMILSARIGRFSLLPDHRPSPARERLCMTILGVCFIVVGILTLVGLL